MQLYSRESYRENYNVYDIAKDRWLLDMNDQKIELCSSRYKNYSSPRSIVLDDTILVISCCNELSFFLIGKEYIKHPKLLYRHNWSNVTQEKCDR